MRSIELVIGSQEPGQENRHYDRRRAGRTGENIQGLGIGGYIDLHEARIADGIFSIHLEETQHVSFQYLPAAGQHAEGSAVHSLE